MDHHKNLYFYEYSTMNESASDLYEKYKGLISTNISEVIECKDKKEEFMHILYDLVVAMNDVYKKAPYYDFANICAPMATCMKEILNEMEVCINRRPNISDSDMIINHELSNVPSESKSSILNYLDQIGDTNE